VKKPNKQGKRKKQRKRVKGAQGETFARLPTRRNWKADIQAMRVIAS
jgi:ribosomal protein L19E